MEKVKVHWKPRAISLLKKQAQWYAETMGETATDRFWNAMIAAGELLSAHPYLGKIEPVLLNSSKIYRSLIQHRDYKIIYFIENDSHIVIVSIWYCRKVPTNG